MILMFLIRSLFTHLELASSVYILIGQKTGDRLSSLAFESVTDLESRRLVGPRT